MATAKVGIFFRKIKKKNNYFINVLISVSYLFRRQIVENFFKKSFQKILSV